MKQVKLTKMCHHHLLGCQVKNKKCYNPYAEVQQFPPTRENLQLEASLNLELDEWLDREDIRLRQMSRELWVKEGDRNSRFFHLSTIIRKRRNCISEIKLDDGTWIRERGEIQNYFLEKFSSLFSSSLPHLPEKPREFNRALCY